MVCGLRGGGGWESVPAKDEEATSLALGERTQSRLQLEAHRRKTQIESEGEQWLREVDVPMAACWCGVWCFGESKKQEDVHRRRSVDGDTAGPLPA